MNQKILCSDCGQEATIAVVHPNTSPDVATPYCESCLNGLRQTEYEIADFELYHFEGVYGVPSHNEYPVDTFKWHQRQDGRFEAAVMTTNTPQGKEK